MTYYINSMLNYKIQKRSQNYKIINKFSRQIKLSIFKYNPMINIFSRYSGKDSCKSIFIYSILAIKIIIIKAKVHCSKITSLNIYIMFLKSKCKLKKIITNWIAIKILRIIITNRKYKELRNLLDGQC